MGSLGPEFESHSAVELIPGGVDSAWHPSEVGKMSASLLVPCVGVATHPGLCPIAKETVYAAPTLCTEYGPNGWMAGWSGVSWWLCGHGELWSALPFYPFSRRFSPLCFFSISLLSSCAPTFPSSLDPALRPSLASSSPHLTHLSLLFRCLPFRFISTPPLPFPPFPLFSLHLLFP